MPQQPTYKASDVLYTSSDGTIMTVNEALNELYDKSNNVVYPDITMYLDSGYIAASNCDASVTIDIPEGYNYLTVTATSTVSQTRIAMDSTSITSGEKYDVSEKSSIKITITHYKNSSGTYSRAMGTIVLSR